MFNLTMLDEISSSPEHFRLLTRVPLTREDVIFPLRLIEGVASDEQHIVLLDLETTGTELENDGITEVGLVKLRYSPSLGCITGIEAVCSLYNDPGKPISDFITQLTGITDNMVAGKKVTSEELAPWFEDDPIVVAHSASFDRGFFDKQFPAFSHLRWACSIKDIAWRALGYESNKLEYLLLKLGYFYEGHRASIDCLALAWLLTKIPGAVAQLVKRTTVDDVIVRAYKSPFDTKDMLKSAKYQWDDGSKGKDKHWYKVVESTLLDDEKAFLTSLYNNALTHAGFDVVDARLRYKPD